MLYKKPLMMFYYGHSIREILNRDFLKLSYVFLMIQIIFHVFHLSEIQEKNVTCNSLTLFSLYTLHCNFLSKPQSLQFKFIKQFNIEHHPSYMKYIIHIFFFLYVFFSNFVMLLKWQSIFFCGVKFQQNAKDIFGFNTLTKSF